MTRERILTVASWIAVLTMFAFIGWRLADQFAPEYPEPTVKYTDSSYEALEYENKENRIGRYKAEQFIRSLADGNL